ncbi:MAG: ATP-binding protein [Bacteroidales bacterium]|nr:ATP-binding protein [Bacteroidales bacterium]
MPILKKEESLPKRPVVIVIYGEPGIGKTSLFNTCESPLLIDFDRGVDRSIMRQDTLLVSKWEDVQVEEKAGTFNAYKTIGIDTAKAALDDFLMSYVIKQDYATAKNKLKAYGAIGDEFKLFVNNRRADNAELVIIAHAKDEKEGDTIKKIPDVTGQSYNLLLRIADQVGYMRTINNKRSIQWEPTDTTIGKNVARLPITEIPNETDPDFPTYMANIIERVKDAIANMSEAQREALEKVSKYQELISRTEDPEDLTKLLAVVSELPPTYSLALRKLVSERGKALGFVVNRNSKAFEKVPLPAPGHSRPAPVGQTSMNV